VNTPRMNTPPMNTSPGKLETALFATGFALSGLVLLALVWSGVGPYEDMARSNGMAGATFFDHTTGQNVDLGLGPVLEQHRAWSAYVTGGITDPPEPGRFYTAEEISHMRDVRGLFDAAKILIPAGLFVMAIRLQRARARSVETMLRLVRDGALTAGVALAAVGIVAALNFLFDPATSNLVRLYPDWYWQGITFRIGLSFIAVAALVAVVASVGLRRARSTRLASA